MRLQERFKYSNYQKSFFEEGGGWSCYIAMIMMMLMVTKTMMIRVDANDHRYCHSSIISYNLLLYWMLFRFFSKYYSINSYKYLITSSTPVLSWTQSNLQQTTASTPLNLSTTSRFVSPPRITVSSSVIQVSRASFLWSSITPSPTLPSVGSSIPSAGEEVRSSHKILQETHSWSER